MELNSAKHHGLVKHDHFIPVKVFPSNFLYWESHKNGWPFLVGLYVECSR